MREVFKFFARRGFALRLAHSKCVYECQRVYTVLIFLFGGRDEAKNELLSSENNYKLSEKLTGKVLRHLVRTRERDRLRIVNSVLCEQIET